MSNFGLGYVPPRDAKGLERMRREEQERKDVAEISARMTEAAPVVHLGAAEADRDAVAFATAVEWARGNLIGFSARCPGGMSFALNEPHGPVRLQFNSDDPAGRWRTSEVMTLEEAVRRKIM